MVVAEIVVSPVGGYSSAGGIHFLHCGTPHFLVFCFLQPHWLADFRMQIAYLALHSLVAVGQAPLGLIMFSELLVTIF